MFPFEKNKTRINEGDIAPFTSKFEVSDFKVDSLHIVAYSSIEGNNAQNERLQRNRANSIIQLLSKNQLEAVSSSVEVKNSWENFYDTIRTIKKWRELAKKDTNELLAYVNKHVADFESILEKQRKASVDIFASIPFSQNNFSYYIQAENNRLLKLIESNPKDSYEELEKLNRLYAFAQYHLNKKSISFKRFKEFKLNEIALSYMPILERYLTNYYYHQDSIKLTNKQVSDLEKLLLENEPSLLFLYNYCVSNTRYLLADKNPKQEDVQTIFHYLERLKRSYFDDPQMKKRIEELVLNLNFLLLEKVFIDIPEEANEDAQKSISFIHEYYQSKNELNDTIALKIGKLAVYYGETQFAVALLQQFNNSPHVLPYLLQLGYYHPSASTNRAYYEQLISSFDMLGDATWCNLFFDTCKIPFQAFDDEKLRDTFCEECISKSEFYKDLLKIK